MTNYSTNIANLLLKKFCNAISKEEEETLQNWLNEDPRNMNFMLNLMKEVEIGSDLSILNNCDDYQIWKVVNSKRKIGQKRFMALKVAVLVAILSISLGFYLFKRKDGNQLIDVSNDIVCESDVQPAVVGAKIIKKNGAILKLEDHIKILTDGTIVDEKNRKLSEVKINDTADMNIIVVPAANYFNLTLQDGTKVWVNANSELRFPSKFGELLRKVELKGEAYFEVEKDNKRPFIVESEETKTRALGTSFNVNAYHSNPVITLLEGSIEVSNHIETKIIKPGQKIEINQFNIDIQEADLQKELAWKNNTFYFKGDNIIRIAQQLKRWYNVDISFAKDVELSNTYTGQIRRQVKLSEVLKMLEFVSDLDFKIDQNKLLIFNKKI